MLVLQNMGAGGAERVMANLANHLDNRMFSIDLVVLANQGEFFSNIENHAVNVFDLKYKRVLWAIPHLMWLLIIRKPYTVLSTLGHINVVMALLRLFFSRTRFIGREANIPSIELQHQRNPWLMANLFKIFYRHLDGVVCQSRDMRKDLLDNFGVPEDKLHLIHNPVDIDGIKTLSLAGGNPYSTGKRNILFVGRLQVQKRPKLLVKLMESFREEEQYHLHILGDGILQEELSALFQSSKCDTSVTFWGLQKNPFRFMKHATVLVVTSSHEGFPNVILEANACGLPVVAFKVKGVTDEIIREGLNGSLIEGDSPREMAARIREVVAMRLPPEKIVFDVAERFGLKIIIHEYEKLLAGT